MTPKQGLHKLKLAWQKYNATLVLVVLIIIFWGYTLFVAFNLQRDIVPDEPYHFQVSKDFSTTWGIPEEVPFAISSGVYIRQNPYLAFWLYGRALTILDLFFPTASPWQQLMYLRIVNSFFSIGTILFVYLIAKELIKDKWWQLLPVFALTHTLMFVLLSAGVNYDNLANMLCAGGAYFLLRLLKGKAFLENSLAWMICIAAAAWIKDAILPLAAAMAVVTVIYFLKNRPQINLAMFSNAKVILLSFFLLILIVGNFSIYGVNLIKHQSLTPACRDYFSDEACKNTTFAIRRAQLALPEKPNMFQAFRQGYPEPIRYAFDTWIRAMLMKIFGIMGGQQSYYPISITYYHILLYCIIALGIRYFKGASFSTYSLSGIVGFYTLALFIKNYDTDLAYGFIQVAHQGRYIFPVIGIIYGLFSYGLYQVPNPWIRKITILITILLFIYGGPIRFLIYYHSVFADWFI
jgi:hypothetical protein